ncbi:zinc ribbon domain-containing protein [Candidatus Sumerlaeota bacterium]|nr:zinc ribbon domain-containing protein [Candidatus Sumerlaeota bacterium]MBI3737124.1 zinc ribbon domain-containing protein [Candidatus Sumerlaeota bacterium]
MPTYEYECPKCGKVFEAFQSMSDPPLKKCANPKCKGKPKRLVGAGSGLIFKGSGFYITDYKKKSGGDASSESKSSESKTEPKSETKTEPKAETKSETKSAPAKNSGSKSAKK